MKLVAIQRDGSPRSYDGPLSREAVEALESTAAVYRAVGCTEPWICYLALSDGVPGGIRSFKSPPIDDRVEIACSAFPRCVGRGLTTKMATLLVELARRVSGEASDGQ